MTSTQIQSAIEWSRQLPPFNKLEHVKYEPILGDAGFRQYIRICTIENSYILVYSPPSTEKNDLFYRLSTIWQQYGIRVPHIYAHCLEQGFLLLTDLGNKRLYDIVNTNDRIPLYKQALDALISIQKIPVSAIKIPDYSENLVLQEMDLFFEWCIQKYLATRLPTRVRSELQQVSNDIINSFVSTTPVVVHRDFHSKNLLVDAHNSIGIVDFQDAVHGPIHYDLISLLKDCYVQLSATEIKILLQYYLENIENIDFCSTHDITEFKRHLNLISIQRHLKAAGIFCRLALRDNKDNYLQHIPRTLSYIINALQQQNSYSGFMYYLKDISTSIAEKLQQDEYN